MRNFTFSFERLLALRAAAERQQAKALGDAIGREETVRLELEDSIRLHEEMRRQREELVPRTAAAGTLLNLERAIHRAEQQRAAVGDAHCKAVAQVAEERERFAARRKERRILEKLRERRRDQWTTDHNRFEQAAMDEIAAARQRLRPGNER